MSTVNFKENKRADACLILEEPKVSLHPVKIVYWPGGASARPSDVSPSISFKNKNLPVP